MKFYAFSRDHSFVHTRRLLPAANPTAVLSTPSIPLAPRFEAVSFDSPTNGVEKLWSISPTAYISTSRIGILFPRNSVEPAGVDVATVRATYGSVIDVPMLSLDSISRPTCQHNHMDAYAANML